ncbi:hypothetical protein BGZ96_010778 [Linnemannia gamsii]|uniref:Uncharacterized protein n=1 Tax=Linnemannia gamsii TaxID=64522 RepID=A0ABQ7KCD9_9FUNG|nr:hypothetical protein BGZ96_010778 [Linnemannia gamsii]
MPTKRTFSFVFRGKQVQVEREYASDEEELINTKPRCLWPDDGRDYAAEEDDYYDEEEQQWDQHQQHEDETGVEPVEQHHHDEHINYAGYEQQDSPGTPPPNSPASTSPAPTSPIPPSPHSLRAEYNENDHHDQHDAYEEEEHDLLPHHPTINRGYIAESIIMVQHPSQPTSSQQEGDYTDEEDDEHSVGQDDTMYTAMYESSDNEEASPMYSQGDTINPFEHIPNPEEDWLIAQERERQRIASKHKLGIVGRGIKYPIPADLLEAPSPTTTFGRTTLWPIQVDTPESSMSRQRLHKLTKPAAQPNFSIGPAFNLASASATTSASASAFGSVSLASTSALSTQAQSLSTQVTSVQEDKKKGSSTSISTSTVVTRPAQPNEIQAIYAAILGRRRLPEKEQEKGGQSRYQGEGKGTRPKGATGGSGSSLYGSEEEQEPEKMDVQEKDDDSEATLAAEELLQAKLAGLGPLNPGLKRHSAEECDVEDEPDEDVTLHAPEQAVVTDLHKCEVFDGRCWGESKRELTVGVYWLHKGERSLRCVYRRFDKFQVMERSDADESSQEELLLIVSQRSASQPTTPQLSLDTGSLSSGYLSS